MGFGGQLWVMPAARALHLNAFNLLDQRCCPLRWLQYYDTSFDPAYAVGAAPPATAAVS